MNYLYHIATKIGSERYKNSKTTNFTHQIAVIAIALSMIVMLFTVATGVAFKEKIRDKIAIFQGHIRVMSLEHQNELSTEYPIENKAFQSNTTLSALLKNEQIAYVQAFAAKTGVIRTQKDFEGIVFKGVANNYHWHGFDDFLVAGRFPTITKNTSEILISQMLSDRLGVILRF